MKQLSKEQYDMITNKVIDACDNLFTECHEAIGTESGDITPEQEELYYSIRGELTSLIVEQIEQNL